MRETAYFDHLQKISRPAVLDDGRLGWYHTSEYRLFRLLGVDDVVYVISSPHGVVMHGRVVNVMPPAYRWKHVPQRYTIARPPGFTLVKPVRHPLE